MSAFLDRYKQVGKTDKNQVKQVGKTDKNQAKQVGKTDKCAKSLVIEGMQWYNWLKNNPAQ